jgi:3'-phosphoadenosine 5'-phosphosulfate sulfotransferase (PAPS reductase)/FAD synthetase
VTPPKLMVPTGHADSVFIVSVSGGKDSAALALAMREANIPARYVFADTQWEAPETYEYLATMERVLGITIDRVRSEEGGMVDIARRKAGFPMRRGRWCTDFLKVRPMRAYHDRVAAEHGDETVSVVGIRAEESAERAKMSEFEESAEWGGYVWRPIMGWTVGDVLAIHHRHGLPVNPLYKRGHGRVGCYPCINETKDGVALIAKHSPDRIDLIRDLELEFSYERVRRNANDEGRFEHPDATFFSPKFSKELVGTGRFETFDANAVERRAEFDRALAAGGDDAAANAAAAAAYPPKMQRREIMRMAPTGIDRVVAWSRTARGGVQLNLLQESPDSGCFRWGMCEPPQKADDDE